MAQLKTTMNNCEKKVVAKKEDKALHAEYQNKHSFILKFKGGKKNPTTFKFSVSQEKVCFLILFEMTFFQHPTSINAPFHIENNSVQPVL